MEDQFYLVTPTGSMFDVLNFKSWDPLQAMSWALILLGSQIYYWTTYTYWSRRNIKGPRPLLIVGNLISYFRHTRQELELEWPKKYGKIYGTYTGSKPFLTVADANVLRRICVKDFDKFPNHMMTEVMNKYQRRTLIVLKGDEWRGMRAIITPTFTANKMKIMLRKFNECSNGLIEQCKGHLDKRASEGVIDLRKMIGGHMMSCAMSAFYGIEPRENNYHRLIEFSDKNRIASEQTYSRFILNALLPTSFLRLINLPLFSEKQLEFFVKTADKIIETRKRSPGKYNDFLQLLLDSRHTADKADCVEANQVENHHAADIGQTSGDKDKWRPVNIRLTDEEVSTQTLMFLMVATETTLSLICHTIYLLAHHQNIQARLYEELEQFKDKPLEYDQISSLSYLDCVISESLRLMSPTISLDRVAEEDYYVEDYNIVIPKGTVINLAFYAILRDPDYWPEPDRFDPDRFAPENKDKIVPGSYCPFGIGPRACIGYRFALLEAKSCLVRLMNEFHFDKVAGTKYPPEQEKASFILNITKNLLVTIRSRQ